MSSLATVKLLGFAGSLRAGSYNRALLEAAREVLPPATELEIVDLAPLPFYNADLDSDEKRPAAVNEFKARISAANGLLIATPEYNYGIPGVLKNAIDWASRPGFKSPLAGKPSAMLGASGGAVGTARAQGQLKQVLLGTVSVVFPHPEFNLGGAAQKFGPDGALTDGVTREHLQKLLAAFADFVRRFPVS